MPMDDGPATPAFALWLAKRVITQHRTTGGCLHCRRDGCDMKSWAIAVVKAQIKTQRMAGNRPRFTHFWP